MRVTATVTDGAARRRLLCVLALTVLFAPAGAIGAAAQDAGGDQSVAGTDCAGGDDGVVLRTDSGLTAVHDGRALATNPFANETTLSFPNVTVSAPSEASLRVASATERWICLTDIAPTGAPVTVTPLAGPRLTVADSLSTLSYGAVDYEWTRTGADLTYSAPASVRIVLADERLRPGTTLRAVDAETRSGLAGGRVTANGTLSLRLPAGTHTVDLRYDPAGTPTDAGQGGVGSGDGADRERTESPAASVGGSVDWTDEIVDYEPSPQTQHVGGFLPVTLLLWLLALWLLLVRERRETTWLILVIVVASVRATSDLLQVTLDGLAGVETSLASVNLVLELTLALLFLQFAAAYADAERLRTRRSKLGLAAVGALGTAAVLTNPWHGLVFADAAVATDPFTYVTTTDGPLGWLLFALDTALFVAGGAMIVRSLLAGSDSTVWRPVGVIGAGLGLAVAVGLLGALELGPVAGYDYSASGVNYFVLLTAVSLAGHGLHRISTSGRQSVVDDLEDPIVVLDDAWAVVECNAAAERLFPDADVGRSFDELLDEPLERPAVGETVRRELTLTVGADGADSAGESPTVTDGGEVERDPEDADGDRGAADDGDASEPRTDDALAARSSITPDARGGGGRDDATDDAATGAEGDGLEAADADRSRPAERDRHFVVTATTVTTEIGSIVGYAVQFADVTSLKRRTAALEAKNDQLDRFARAVTSDLRRPMSTAATDTDRAIDLLASADGAVDPSRLRQYVGRIGTALDRMAGVVEDILALARDADLEADPRAVSFRRIVDSTWERVDAPSATLRVASDGEILADPDHLERLLEQLFRNAVEHGGEDVTVTVGLDADGFTVADDGPGVPRDRREDLFEPGTTSKEDGSGLGLAIATQRADAHGWSIHLAEDAENTVFAVTGCDVALDRDGSTEVDR